MDALTIDYSLGTFTNNEFPIDVREEESLDATFLIARNEQAPFKIIFNYCIPLVIIVAGSVFLIKRRRK